MGLGTPPRNLARIALVLAVCLGNAAALGEDAKPVVASFDKQSVGLDEGCVATAELQRGTERFVGRQVFGVEEQADVLVVIDLRSEKRANITLLDPERRPLGRRGIEGESCSELSEGLVLALSLMLDFTTEDVERLRQSEAEAAASGAQVAPTSTPVPTTAPPEHPPEEDSTPRKAPATDERSSSSEEPAQDSVIRFHGGVEGRLGIGFAPLPVFGFGAALGMRTRNDWLIELRGGYWFEREFSRRQGSIAISAAEGGLAVAPALLELGPTRFRAGAVGSLGRVVVVGEGYEGASTGSALALRAGLLARLELDAGPLVAQVSTQLDAPLIGYRAVVATPRGPSEQFKGGPLIFVLSAGVAVPF